MWNQDQLKATLDFAARAHAAQTIPDSPLPYVVHLFKVATEVLRACQDDPALDADLAVTCALLHDVVEDGGASLDQVASRFGPAVAGGVGALTKDPALPREGRMADSLRRVQAQPREVWVVKLADRVTNLEPPPPSWGVEKRRAYREEGRAILCALGPAHPGLARRLEGKLASYAAWCG
jgi:(p)ppGpp synthase/HD superfamily hydrolase